jgi:hypothetical protein
MTIWSWKRPGVAKYPSNIDQLEIGTQAEWLSYSNTIVTSATAVLERVG